MHSTICKKNVSVKKINICFKSIYREKACLSVTHGQKLHLNDLNALLL